MRVTPAWQRIHTFRCEKKIYFQHRLFANNWNINFTQQVANLRIQNDNIYRPPEQVRTINHPTIQQQLIIEHPVMKRSLTRKKKIDLHWPVNQIEKYKNKNICSLRCWTSVLFPRPVSVNNFITIKQVNNKLSKSLHQTRSKRTRKKIVEKNSRGKIRR